MWDNLRRMKKIPKSFRGLLWSRKPETLDLEKDKNYVIHQILAFGSLDQVKWLLKAFSKKEVIEVFLKSPRKNYSPPAFNLVKNHIQKFTTRRSTTAETRYKQS